MEIDEARRFAGTHHRAVMATRKRDGNPQLSPVTVATGTDGSLWVSSRETAYKVRNLRRDPRVSLCSFTDAFFGKWLQVDGTARIVALPEAMDLLVGYYRSVSGEHPDWGDYRAAMVRERRVIIAVDIERVGPDFSG